MKTIFRFSLIIAILAVLPLWAVPVTAATKTTITFTDTVVSVTGGEYTFPDGNIHLRGLVVVLRAVSTDPRLSGTNTLVINGNFDSNGNGPMWATTHFVTDEGGVWDGTWEGQGVGMVPVSLHGRATGLGIYNGMRCWFEINNGLNTATILEH